MGLVVLGRAREVPAQRSAAAFRGQGLEAWLESLTRAELLGLVREQLARNRELRRRLELRAATARSDGPVVRERVLALVDPAPCASHGYGEYADARAYSLQAEEAVTALRTLTGQGRGAQAVVLAREAMAVLGKAYESVDDSSGHAGAVAADPAGARLEAMRAVRPDPEETAELLARQPLGDDHDAFGTDPADYGEVLGTAGLAGLRRLAAEAHRRKPSGWAGKYLMERLAKAAGDVDGLVALHAADLSPTGSTHLVIAEELEAAGRADEALTWAERGLREADRDPRLEDHLCDRYVRLGRDAEAVSVRRDGFRVRLSPGGYQRLPAAARAHGTWEAERPAALDPLRADAAGRGARYGGRGLLDALLDDGDLEAAWQAAADGYADDRQWLPLADKVRGQRPADALPVHLRLIEPLKKITGDADHQHIARLLAGCRDCHRRLGTPRDFTDYLTALRTEQKRKRNLMTILDQHGL